MEGQASPWARALTGRAMCFLYGVVSGGVIVALMTLPALRRQSENFSQYAGNSEKLSETWKQAASQWQQRAQTCEAKFTVGTIIYEQHPVASIPVLRGFATVNIGSDVEPAWYVPVQVKAYTNLPNARYVWMDMRTAELKGTFFALPPSEMGKE